MAKTRTKGTFGINTNTDQIRKDPPKKRKPKFSAGAELKNAVKKRKPKFSAGAEVKKTVDE